ncbi:MAG: hypothetical protein Q8N36_03140 [bacterium]|nr:hypothetical protein [bacterium]
MVPRVLLAPYMGRAVLFLGEVAHSTRERFPLSALRSPHLRGAKSEEQGAQIGTQGDYN